MRVFNRCDFLTGGGSSVVMIIPALLPEAETYTVSISSDDIRFRAGDDEIAVLPYNNHDIFQRIANHTQIGVLENPPGSELPSYITNVAYVEVRAGGL